MVHANCEGGPNRAQNSKPRNRGRGRGGNAGVSTRQVRSSNAETRNISGNDIIATITLNTAKPVGSILTEIPINPIAFATTRVAAEASLWSRWKPTRLGLQVISSAGSMTSGQFTLAWTADSNERLVSGQSAIQRTACMRPSIVSHIAQRASMNIPLNTSQKWYMIEGKDDSDTTHGKVYLILSGALGNITGNSSVTLTVRLNWAFTFFGPLLPGNKIEEAVYADSDYSGYHTTSISDWASGNRLMLKAHAGGGAVPFPTAKPQTVYKIDAQASLKYYRSDNTEDAIVYGVLIPNYYVKTFAVFVSEANAKRFSETGDSSYCINYAKAGPIVSPDNPAWFRQEITVASLQDRIVELEALLKQASHGNDTDKEDFHVVASTSSKG